MLHIFGVYYSVLDMVESIIYSYQNKYLGGFLSSTSMSTRTVLDKAGSSLVNVPCLTNREEFWLLVLLVPLVALCALAQLIERRKK